MAIFLTALVLLSYSPLPAALVLAAAIVASVVAVRKSGKLAIFAVGPLLDLLFLAPYFVVLWRPGAHATVGISVGPDNFRPAIPISLAINAAAGVAIIWLAAGWPLPERMLPLRGLWARKLLAAVALLAATLSPTPMVIAALREMQFGYVSTPGVPTWVSLLPLAVVGLLGIGYATPLWLVLVHGWSWLKPPAPTASAGND